MSTPTASDLTKTAQLLNELQKQLIQYKTAMDSIDTASGATHNVALEVEKLSRIIQALSESQADLAKNFDDTRKALQFAQQKSQQVSKDLEDMSQNFSRSIQQSMERTIQTVDEKVAQFVAPDRNALQQEVRKLKLFLFLNIIVMFVLFFSAFMYLYPQPGNTGNISSRSTTPQTIQPLDRQQSALPTASAVSSTARIQVLNGCGIEGVAKNFVSYLENANYAVHTVENADNFNYQRSVILLNGDYTLEAGKIAALFGVSSGQIKPAGDKWKNHNITVILGKDYARLKPSLD